MMCREQRWRLTWSWSTTCCWQRRYRRKRAQRHTNKPLTCLWSLLCIWTSFCLLFFPSLLVVYSVVWWKHSCRGKYMNCCVYQCFDLIPDSEVLSLSHSIYYFLHVAMKTMVFFFYLNQTKLLWQKSWFNKKKMNIGCGWE